MYLCGFSIRIAVWIRKSVTNVFNSYKYLCFLTNVASDASATCYCFHGCHLFFTQLECIFPNLQVSVSSAMIHEAIDYVGIFLVGLPRTENK